MDYGKMVDGKIKYAPACIDIGKSHVYNPTAEQLVSEGYKRLDYTLQPDAPEGYQAVWEWQEENDSIVQVWHFEELPEVEPSAEEIINILTGEDEA